MDCRDKMDPVTWWWENFGFKTPHLQTLVVKVLSQVSSVGMCEEIWQDNDFPCRRATQSLGVEMWRILFLFETTSDYMAKEMGFQNHHLLKKSNSKHPIWN